MMSEESSSLRLLITEVEPQDVPVTSTPDVAVEPVVEGITQPKEERRLALDYKRVKKHGVRCSTAVNRHECT